MVVQDGPVGLLMTHLQVPMDIGPQVNCHIYDKHETIKKMQVKIGEGDDEIALPFLMNTEKKNSKH